MHVFHCRANSWVESTQVKTACVLQKDTVDARGVQYQGPHEKPELCPRASSSESMLLMGCDGGGGCGGAAQRPPVYVFAVALVPSSTTWGPSRSMNLFDMFVTDWPEEGSDCLPTPVYVLRLMP